MLLRRHKPTNKQPRDKFLPKLTTAFFDRPKLTALIWLAIAVFGIASYTTLLRREGFPSVNVPFAIVNGTYFVNDPARVDQDVVKPMTEIATHQAGVSTVQGQSTDNFFSISLQYKENVDSSVATKAFEQAVKDSGVLPASVQAQYDVLYFGATGGDVQPIDAAVSFFNTKGTASVADTSAKAESAVKWLNDHKPELVKSVFLKTQFETATDVSTGHATDIQRSFDRYGEKQEQTNFFNSIIIGVTKTDGADVIKFDEQVRGVLDQLKHDPAFADYSGEVSASSAPSIKDSLSELQRVLLEGLLAVLIVGSLVIAIRASLITVVSMVTVLVTSLGVLYLIGYTLNVITLFALILGLALIVDDTIIMVEAIDAARGKEKDAREAVRTATRKVSRAMVAATLTACLSFVPLLFVGGILGDFIQAIPVTIIISLLISLLVALIFIPFFARFVLLGKKQMGKQGVKEVAAGFEAKVAGFITRPMLWARGSRKKLFGVGLTAVFIGLGFVLAGGLIAKNVVFNIFPPTKDTNGLALAINFPQGTSVEEAQAIAGQADQLAAQVVGQNFVHSSYYGTGNAQTASEQIELTNYNKREVTSPELVKQLQEKYDGDFKAARVSVAQVDIGPPSAAFTVEIDSTNRQDAFKAAAAYESYMKNTELIRVNGTTAHFVNVNVSSPDQYLRVDNRPVVTVTANFDGTDTTTLVTLAQNSLEKEFNNTKLSQFGLSTDKINYNIGFESENQDSFRTLALAFPILLVVMFILLAFQFRSLLQPLLIFMAIPFSFFGIMLGLNLTDNAISFFTMLGFFALIGLSIKNTILLTDFANQKRHEGAGAIDAAVAALEERFRPLFATSMTAVVSLIPLALASPFWEGLAVVLIFGLLSNTLLVVTVFPYYYLGAEFLRQKVSRAKALSWLAGLVAVVAISSLLHINFGLLLMVYLALTFVYPKLYRRISTKVS